MKKFYKAMLAKKRIAANTGVLSTPALNTKPFYKGVMKQTKRPYSDRVIKFY